MSAENLKRAAELFAAKSDKSADEVLKELKTLAKQLGDETKAIVKYKSDHKFELSRAAPKEFKVRVIAKEQARKQAVESGVEMDVASLTLISDDGKTANLHVLTLWGDRIQFLDQLELNKTYSLLGRIQERRGVKRLVGISNVKPIDDSEVVALRDLGKRNIKLPTPAHV